MSEVESKESNSPKYTYRIKYHVPGVEGYEIALVHADHYEYDKDCVSLVEYCEVTGDPIIKSSIKGWFCIERQQFDDDDAKEAALEEVKGILTRLVETLLRSEESKVD